MGLNIAPNIVPNKLIIKSDSGTTEGTDQYTFDGSATKTLDLKAGTNVTLTEAAGSVTIASSSTDGLNIPTVSANGGKVLAVNTGATALEWINPTAVASNVIGTYITIGGKYKIEYNSGTNKLDFLYIG